MKKFLFFIIIISLTLTSVLRADNLNSFTLLSTQKENYKNNDWSRFFGHALFYRIQTEQNKIEFNSTFFSLETLALLRHCQFEKAEGILKVAQEINRNLDDQIQKNKNEQELKKVEYVLALAKDFQKSYFKPNTESSTTSSPLTQPIVWRVKTKQIALLTTPEQLRVNVQNLCKL